MTIRNLVTLLSLFTLIGCELTPIRSPDNTSNHLIASTDTTIYNLKEGYVQVRLTVENQSDSVAYFAHCGERCIFMLYIYSSSKWEERGGWGLPCLSIYTMGSIPLEPCSIYSDVIDIRQAGNYRFMLYYAWEPHCDNWPGTLYSNEFTVQ